MHYTPEFEAAEARAARFGEDHTPAGPHSYLVCNDRGQWSRVFASGTVQISRATAQGLFNRYTREASQ